MAARNHSRPDQQPCIHCGECARACPESLDPRALFFSLVDEDWSQTKRHALDACSECNRCVEVCPSHIPLLDWFRWGKSGLAARQRAGLARARFLARNARLERGRGARPARRDSKPDAATMPAQTISKAEVMAAIARGRSRRKGGTAQEPPQMKAHRPEHGKRETY